MKSAYRIMDWSDEDGEDFAVEDEFGEIGRFFSRVEAEHFLADLRYVEQIDRELFGEAT
jgi:hypothetical protein